MDTSNPILAVSSPPGRSARGIIRITGEHLAPFIAQVLDPVPPAGSLAARRLRDPPLPCLALFHPAPRSFTSQDMLELQIPGNPALLDRVLHCLLTALRRHDPGARLAEPGEFTQRAFLAGRIDLTRAEGIAATIGARSDAQLHAAKLLRTGRLGQWAESLIDRLAQLLALVEAGIDFVDQDDVSPISPQKLDEGLAAVELELEGMLTRSRSWSALEALPWVVLVGRPNAGKSTLFNALLGRERAVTSEVAGTTRDVLTEPLRINTPTGEAEVMLVDIAGLDTPEGFLNEAMQSAARSAIARAELIVVLHDPLDPEAPMTPPRRDIPVIEALTKSDRGPVPDYDVDKQRNASRAGVPKPSPGSDPIGQLLQGGGAPFDALQSESPSTPIIALTELKSKEEKATTGGPRATPEGGVAHTSETYPNQPLSTSIIPPLDAGSSHPEYLRVSALTGRGLDDLRERIAAVVRGRAVTVAGEMLALTERHRDELAESLAAVRAAREVREPELIAEVMRRGLDHLGALGGKVTADDVIGRIFATFCVGK